MEDGGDNASSFLRVDEFNESNGQVEGLDLSQQSNIDSGPWIEQSDELGDPTGNPPTTDTADTGQPAGPRSPGRPTLRRDQWAPGPQHLPPPPPPDALPEDADVPTDSLSLAQLRRLVQEMPKKEATPYAFEYHDTSSFEEEVEELFDYSVDERNFLDATFLTFSEAWQRPPLEPAQREGTAIQRASWVDAEESDKILFLRNIKDQVAQSHKKQASNALHALTYLALGCWKETAKQLSENPVEDGDIAKPSKASLSTSKSQVMQMKANIALIADNVGLDTILAACETGCAHPSLEDSSTGNDVASDSRDFPEPTCLPRCCFTLMYLLIDLARRQQSSDENSRLTRQCREIGHKTLQYLTSLLADLRWNDNPTLPLQKILALYWKLVLLTFGSTTDAHKITDTLNEKIKGRNGHPAPRITASPLDYHFFRQEITSKYPAFDPPQPLFPFDADATSMVPPLQDHGRADSVSDMAGPASVNGKGSSILHQPVHIATPAPSPPPSPAGPGGKGIKKQNYQTNQLFPFLYPPLNDASNSIGGKGGTELQDLLVGRKWEGQDVPTSIMEAADIFASRMRASRAMRQLWDERVKFIKYERGYSTVPTSANADESKGRGDSEYDDPLSRLDNDSQRRLNAVEEYYASSLPKLQSVVIVLLKVLLQTVTTLVTQPNAPNGLQTGFESPEQHSQDKSRVDGNGSQELDGNGAAALDNINNIRSQEIMGKSVAGILLLLLKWFKLSHVLKFEYLTQLLLDSNYIQLILKLFTHQELERAVNFKCESQSLNFFNWCRRDANPSIDFSEPNFPSPPLVNDFDDAAPPPIPRSNTVQPVEPQNEGNGAGVDGSQPPGQDADGLGYTASSPPQAPIMDFSWRAFFTAITHLRVLQKTVKSKPHRQLLMVSYKYSNILKKSLKIPEPVLRLYTLKIIKGQVPYSHRKWRQSNMRIITAIYLHCKPELRDDWLAGLAIEEEVGEALPQEQALRSLTYWYNLRRYPEAMSDEPEKVRGLLEEEQDFFVRELEAMEVVGSDRGAMGEGEIDPLDVSSDYNIQDREMLLARTRELVEQGEREYAARSEERNVRW